MCDKIHQYMSKETPIVPQKETPVPTADTITAMYDADKKPNVIGIVMDFFLQKLDDIEHHFQEKRHQEVQRRTTFKHIMYSVMSHDEIIAIITAIIEKGNRRIPLNQFDRRYIASRISVSQFKDKEDTEKKRFFSGLVIERRDSRRNYQTFEYDLFQEVSIGCEHSSFSSDTTKGNFVFIVRDKENNRKVVFKKSVRFDFSCDLETSTRNIEYQLRHFLGYIAQVTT